MTLTNRRQRFATLNLIYVATSVALFCAALVVPTFASAQDALNDYGIPQVATNAMLPTGQPSPTSIIAMVVNVLLGVLGVAAVAMVIYGGFLWMTAGGNEERVKKAKAILGGAIIGLAIVFASYVIAEFVISNIKSSSSVGFVQLFFFV